jgi:hypothetical protein
MIRKYYEIRFRTKRTGVKTPNLSLGDLQESRNSRWFFIGEVCSRTGWFGMKGVSSALFAIRKRKMVEFRVREIQSKDQDWQAR